MKREQFEAFVQQLEIYAHRHPTAYKIRVGLLAMLGYAYILLILLGLFGAIALLIVIMIYSHQVNAGFIKLLFLLGIPLFIAGRSLLESIWTKFPPPSGLALNRQQVPQLFQLVEELTASLNCPPFHHLLLTSDYNAGVFQIPKRLLSGQSNYLLIGLPLLQAVSPEQFRAILAHEFGHLSGNHSQFANWIYRMRKTWMQILERLNHHQEGGTNLLFNSFFNWYSPFFNAYSFVLARADEYEADSCAAKLTGNETIASALVNTDIKNRFLEVSFWQKIDRQINEIPEPPAQLFTQMGETLQTPLDSQEVTEWLQQALAIKTNCVDTHPCLNDRLQALGFNPQEAFSLIKITTETAADTFLGEALYSLREQLNQEWQTTVNFQWKERYNQTQKRLQRLHILNQKASQMLLPIEEMWEQAQLTDELVGNSEAMPLLKALLQRNENHGLANYLLGRILLEQQDQKGIEYLEAGMKKESKVILEGCQLIYEFLQRQGSIKEAENYQKRAEQHYEKLLLSQQERTVISERDNFQSHQLSLAKINQLREQLAQYSEIKTAYLVQKTVTYFPEQPFYILGIKRHSSYLNWNNKEKDQILVDSLAKELVFSEHILITILNHSNIWLERKMKRIDNEPIYS